MRLQGCQAEVICEHAKDFEQNQKQGVAAGSKDDTEQPLCASICELDELQIDPEELRDHSA